MILKKAKAAVLTGINIPFEVREYDLVPPPEGMAKIKLIASGICGTDIHIHKGKLPVNMPSIIGHEFVGTVEELSDGNSKKYGISCGDNVIVCIACPCGECLLCSNGDDANCINMGVTNGGDPSVSPHLYGGYAEYNYSPVANLIKIPPDLDAKMACVFACAGPTVIHAFNLAKRANCHIEKSNTAVVQGLGPVGTFAIIYFASLGIKNIVAVTAGSNMEREESAVKLGATEVLNIDRMGMDEVLNHVKGFNGGIGADVVFEASGNPNAVPQGMDMLRNRGVYLVPGQYSNSGNAEIPPQMITFKALHIIGSSQYSISDVKQYLEFLSNNPQLHAPILSIAKEYSIDDINKAIEDAKSLKNIKTMLV